VAIHASRYSGGRGRRHSPIRKKSGGKRKGFGRKFVGLLLLAVVAGAAYVAFALVQPFPKLPNQKDYPVGVNYKDRINILLARIDGEEVKYLAVVSVAGGARTRIVTVSPDVVVKIPQGNGEGSLAMAMRLGNGGEGGVNLLRDAVSRLVAAPIDGYVISDSNGWRSVESIYGDSYDSLWTSVSSVTGRFSVAWQGLPKGVYTSFSKLEFAKLASGDFGVAEVVNGAKYETARSAVGAGFDTATFDNEVGSGFSEKSVVRDHPRVSVVNGSGVAGVGIEMARYVRNLGGQVVNVSTADKTVKSTEIVDHLGGSTLAVRLVGVTRGSLRSDTKLSQADIEVVIGEDAKTWF